MMKRLLIALIVLVQAGAVRWMMRPSGFNKIPKEEEECIV